jgi:hypothetical protein
VGTCSLAARCVPEFDEFLYHYNHHHSHTAVGGKPAVDRVNDLPGQYSLALPLQTLGQVGSMTWRQRRRRRSLS